MIDYARPLLMAEKQLKDMHDACLDKKFKAAIEHGLAAIAETKLAVNSIYFIIEEEEARRGVQ
jgi:hypothetical protein